ncbi:glycosyltransferase [Paracoccus sp. JM45]|uniref:glycosyltransferase n=1 Tax=Paracoccus sp. JM45 TaxID=2283626 RepID=UPI000E6BC6A1|nr:glycosyltransferase [Paracoccus sp. JM45]RJE78485.1 glycosyltransferase family 1 protein [Paracoccus sp. JM45]
MVYKRRVDLFYHGFEEKALDRPFGRLQSRLHLTARTAYRRLRHRQLYTGFYTAFRNLRHGLERLGVDVHVNDFSYARKNPNQAIGIAGFPQVYNKVRLPNPAVFGPGYVPRPDELDEMTASQNIRIFTQPSEWYCEIWREKLGDRIQPMFVPIIMSDWPDLSKTSKRHDVIIYDKIRWNRDAMVPRILGRMQERLHMQGLSSVILRYGNHQLGDFKAALSSSRAMIFLCEHETQGLAYQEAMASGIPILAWNEGTLVDPVEKKLVPNGVFAPSVPYFDERCGTTFTEESVEASFDQFWAALSQFDPRSYVEDNLSVERSAYIYLKLLDQAGTR